MIVPVVAVTLPSDLTKQQNGKLVPCSLSGVYFNGVGHGSLHKNTARAWNALAVAAYAATGVSITIASTADAYRSYDQQETVFRNRYRRVYNPLTCTLDSKRVWNGVTWYKLRNVAPVASPGTSNHGWALAVDAAIYKPKVSAKPLSITSDQTLWSWLLVNALSFGFSWEGVADSTKAGFEPWHLRFFSGDVIPQRVLEVEAFLGTTPA